MRQADSGRGREDGGEIMEGEEGRMEEGEEWKGGRRERGSNSKAGGKWGEGRELEGEGREKWGKAHRTSW